MPPRGRAPPRRHAGRQAGPPAAATEPEGGRAPEWHARVTEQADTLCRTASDLLARRGASLPRAELRRARGASVWLCAQILEDTVDDAYPGVHAEGIHALLWLPPRRRVGLLALLAVSARALASADVDGPNFQDQKDLHLSLAKIATELLKAATVDGGRAAHEQQRRQRAALREAAMAALAFAVGPMQLLHVYSGLLGATGPRRMPPADRSLVVDTVYVLLKTLDIMFLRSPPAASGPAPALPGASSAADTAGTPGAAAPGLQGGRERALGLLLGLSSSSVLEHALHDTFVSSLEAGADRVHATVQVYGLLGRTCDMLAVAAGRRGVPLVELFGEPSCGRTAEAARAVLSGPCLQYAMAAHAVAQLAAADGGRAYGLPPAALLPPAVDGRVCPMLCCGGLLASVRMWSWCLQLGVPLVAVSRRAVHEMALRLVTVVTACAAEEEARRQQEGQAHKREQAAAASPGGGGGCSGHAAGWIQHPPGQTCGSAARAGAGSSGASGSGGAAAGASAAAGPAARRGLALALPLADCPGAALDAVRCASLSAHHPPVLYGEDRDGWLEVRARPCSGEAGPLALAAAACRFWSAAVPALGTVLEFAEAGGCWPSVQRVTQELSVAVPDLQAFEAPDAAPPPNLAAALAAGYLPLRERAIRAAVSVFPGCNAGAAAMIPLLGGWPLVFRLLSYGAPYEADALMATGAKVVRTLLPPAAASSNGNVVMGDAATMTTMYNLCHLLCVTLDRMMATMAVYVAAQRSVGWTLRTGAGAGTAYSAGPPRLPFQVRPPAGTEAAEAWARGPSRQLLHLVHRALRLWLPAAAQAAASVLRLCRLGALADTAGPPPPARPADAPSASAHAARSHAQSAANAASAVLKWVPVLLHAHARALTAQLPAAAASSGAAAAAAGKPERAAASSLAAAAAVWRHLVLHDMDTLGLIGGTLEVVLPEAPDAPGVDPAQERGAEDPMAAALQAVRAAFMCVAAAFPGEVAAALRDGRLPPRCPSLLSDSGLAAELAREGRRVAAGPGGKHSAPVPSIASRALPDVALIHDGLVGADELGAALLASAEAPAGWPAEPHACSNPRCTNLAGRSEAELPLLACSACGAVRYCGPGCQRAHWARHKQACRVRGGD